MTTSLTRPVVARIAPQRMDRRKEKSPKLTPFENSLGWRSSKFQVVEEVGVVVGDSGPSAFAFTEESTPCPLLGAHMPFQKTPYPEAVRESTPSPVNNQQAVPPEPWLALESTVECDHDKRDSVILCLVLELEQSRQYG